MKMMRLLLKKSGWGDNDNLSALVANLVEADLLVLLTDQDGLYTSDPRMDPSAEMIHEITSPEIPDGVWQGGRRDRFRAGNRRDDHQNPGGGPGQEVRNNGGDSQRSGTRCADPVGAGRTTGGPGSWQMKPWEKAANGLSWLD